MGKSEANRKKQIYYIIGIILVLAAPFIAPSQYVRNLFCLALINVIVVLGLNFITGLAGNMNLGTAGIFAIGAYTSALLSTKLGVSPWIGLILAGVMGVVVGLCLGFPSLRVKGVYLSLTTIAFGEIVRLWLNNTRDITNGTAGVVAIPKYNLFGFEFNTDIRFYYFALFWVIVFTVLSVRLVNSKWGRAFKALSDNPEAVESLGIDIAKVKIIAFTLTTVFGSMAGAMYAHYVSYIDPATFNFDWSVKYVIMLMIGGIGLIRGNIFGAIVCTLLPEALRIFGDYYLFIYYIIAFIAAILLPNGWLVGIERLFKAITAKAQNRGK